jgi:hypothetical protein
MAFDGFVGLSFLDEAPSSWLRNTAKAIPSHNPSRQKQQDTYDNVTLLAVTLGIIASIEMSW